MRASFLAPLVVGLSSLALVPACKPASADVMVPSSRVVRFGETALDAGTTVVRRDEASLDGRVRYGLMKSDLEISIEETSRVDVHAVEYGVPTDLTVRYDLDRTRTWTSWDGEEEKLSPVMRKTEMEMAMAMAMAMAMNSHYRSL